MTNVPTGAATAAARKTSPAGRSAITQREGCVLTAYTDSAGIWTIGVGHTSAAGAPKVTKGMRITAAQADEILSRDLASVEVTVNGAVKVPLNQNEFDALVSLVFNIGGGAFKGSTLLRKLNAGDRAGAADQFLVWNKATVKGKKVALPGLTVRREAERRQFLRPDASQPAQEAPNPALAPSESTTLKPSDPKVSRPETGDLGTIPKPSTAKPVAATGGVVILITAVATWWHDIISWIGSFF